MRNKPEMLALTGVSLKDLQEFYLSVWDTNLFSYYYLYFDTMFNSTELVHPMLVLTVYLREMLRIATEDDVKAFQTIDNFEMNLEMKLTSFELMTSLAKMNHDVILKHCKQDGE